MERDPKTFYLWTIQLAQWRKLKPGIKLIDITVKSGLRWFAPYPFDLNLYKAGQMSEEEYTHNYLAKMEESLHEDREEWDRLSRYVFSAYACYCTAGKFCHRHLFVKKAKEHLESMGWTVKLMGEYPENADEIDIPEAFQQVVSNKQEKNTAQTHQTPS